MEGDKLELEDELSEDEEDEENEFEEEVAFMTNVLLIWLRESTLRQKVTMKTWKTCLPAGRWYCFRTFTI